MFNTKLLVFNTKFIIFTPLISVLSRPHHLVKSSFLIKSHHFSYRQFIVFHRKFIIFIMQNTSLTARQLRDHACGTCERQTFNYNDNIRIHIETSQNRPKKQWRIDGFLQQDVVGTCHTYISVAVDLLPNWSIYQIDLFHKLHSMIVLHKMQH